jgi:hypothetical protein
VLRARAAAHRSEEARHAVEAARLDAEADAVLAVRAAGVSPWGLELPPPVMQQVLELLQWDPAVCGVMRAVSSTWSSFLDSLLPRLRPRRSLAVMQGKLSWYQSVTVVDLLYCENGVCGPLAELAELPSLRSLTLPASCAESAVDAEAVCGLTTLTTLRFYVELDENVLPVEEVSEWVLDLSRLTTLNTLHLKCCHAVTDKQVLALSHLTGLKYLNLMYCINVSSEGLRSEQPHLPHHAQPPQLSQRDERGAARSEQPHRTHHARPRRLPQRHERGATCSERPDSPHQASSAAAPAWRTRGCAQ